MSRRGDSLQPRWLVSLLVVWGRREAYGRELGWYGVSPMLKAGIPIQARSYEPTGYADGDYAELEACLKRLEDSNRRQLLAVIRYCKPWTARAIDIEHPLDTDTWLYHLKRGLAQLSTMMEESRRRIVDLRQSIRSESQNQIA